ncbi:ATP-binding cassette domain-containing protein [Halovenus sp. WSH3]|uniref:ATP-binding cassette domain-containing protein n=1 Tax=Halovenus carboxidivorans TaxID=2692199 RepID=A0A6B0T2B5_9EURY|nr:ABC transporter ATP-binding protein [Halovenus carboxidivorans]MXR51277.1 ATP-binding cassette domain-containing protein [Halovenus carboxidivorans]
MGQRASTGRRSSSETDPLSEGSDERGQSSESGQDNADPALVVDGISKRFGGDDGVLAVDDVSFRVDRGSVVGLLGPNGAGKTTLIKSVLGMVLPDDGSVQVFGSDVTDGRRTAYADVDAMLEGARNDYWRLTVRENLRYFATISGVDPDSVADRHERLLDRLDLSEYADTPVRNLSRGMKQKVSLASVLAGGAELVFLDEPTLGLDIESSRTLRTELKRLAREEGLTIFVSSHNMSVIEDVCDRVIVMSDGQVVADDSVDALLTEADRDLVRIESSDLDAATVQTLRSQFEVTETAESGQRVRVDVRAGGRDLYAVMDVLREADVRIERIETIDPTLEDVFVDLTGDGSGLSADSPEGSP